ncbi:phosphatidylinositol-3-phosphatase myotubularin-1 isoform X6 [Populus trichocarpa]|uniref:phosphatidylinositol-3-phosphatase myotubularin-1 isoform X6 n=1 Tax=Populus trichocarpa TaxID=3694 RepID=UPI000D18AEA9|nr:phosphatidylinositol-3-phosphatase myotubularin-1 isoform X6 [Populus trichocarpa]|eukprot:XP_024465254.1 phosphatidylinositol-3-phosphatase myotubularin-1 isoform X5 [Populus trichocarpa]
MSASRRSTSLSDSSAEIERMESTGSWDDALDWFKLEVQHPASRSVSHHANYKCLLEAERVVVEGYGVVLINTDEAGTLIVTNFRLIFLSEGTENIIALGTIPLATIEKFSKMVVKSQSAPRQSEKTPSQRLLQVIGRDMRIIVFGFRPKTKQIHINVFVCSNTDEKLVAALCSQLGGDKKGRRKLYIADARPRKNALANVAMGGGSESPSHYFQSEVVFFGIDNIHAMRESLSRLRDYLDTHGSTSSDGTLSLLRHGGWTWGGGNLSSMSASVATLGDSGWLIHVQSVLAGSAWIAARVALESASVLVHCSDGWDRTSQLISLANLLLDPYYRTFTGFQALIEKDWLAFGHPFEERMGMPTVSGCSDKPLDLSRQSSVGSFPSSPMRQSSGSFAPQAPSSSHAQNQYSPIFLQWIDCVSQLLRMYPFAFEFSSAFLVDLLDCVLSCRFGNFFCNSEKERQLVGVSESCGCLWAYLADLRSSEGRSHVHYNLFYSPLKHKGPLLPPAAALAPTLWPQFHLRWACPSEAQAGELEAQCRNMSLKFSELQKAKEGAEKKAKETTNAMESLSAELQNEKRLSSSAMALAKRASKESAAIKRAIQSLGCKVHFAGGGDTTVDIETNPMGITQESVFSHSKRESDGIVQHQYNSDLSISISAVADDVVSNNPLDRVCGAICPSRARDGGCRWPEAGCAQLCSQFIGVKANYDAIDSLSIYETYFDTREEGK